MKNRLIAVFSAFVLLLAGCNYEMELTTGKRFLEQGDYKEAIRYLALVDEKQPSEESRRLLAEAHRGLEAAEVKERFPDYARQVFAVFKEISLGMIHANSTQDFAPAKARADELLQDLAAADHPQRLATVNGTFVQAMKETIRHYESLLRDPNLTKEQRLDKVNQYSEEQLDPFKEEMSKLEMELHYNLNDILSE